MDYFTFLHILGSIHRGINLSRRMGVASYAWASTPAIMLSLKDLSSQYAYIKDACLSYLRGNESFKIDYEKISWLESEGHKISDTSYSIVRKAHYSTVDGKTIDIALKELKGGGNEVEQESDQIKVSFALLLIIPHTCLSHRQSFTKEIRNTAKLEHENIVKIIGFYFDEGNLNKLVIASEWVGGGTLRPYIKNHSDCNLRDIVSNLFQITTAQFCNRIHLI